MNAFLLSTIDNRLSPPFPPPLSPHVHLPLFFHPPLMYFISYFMNGSTRAIPYYISQCNTDLHVRFCIFLPLLLNVVCQ